MEESFVDTLTGIRDDINNFLDNCKNSYPWEYELNIGDQQSEYSKRLSELVASFNNLKQLCPEDWNENGY